MILDNIRQGVSIEFINTSFAYGGGKNILEHINFRIQAGELVHISGKSGSGKSSLLKLLTGAYKSFQGNILIENHPIGNYELQSLRAATGILLNAQDIFHGTLWENITMGDEAITLQEVTAYIEKLGLTSFVQSDRQGYKMKLDPIGKSLSKQIRQKILLIRALIGKHRLLLLEEPFVDLDPSARNLVIDLLKKNKYTTVLIASDDTSISKECDRVLLL